MTSNETVTSPGFVATGTTATTSDPASRSRSPGPRTFVTNVWTRRWWSMNAWNAPTAARPRNTGVRTAADPPRPDAPDPPLLGHEGSEAHLGIRDRRDTHRHDAGRVAQHPRGVLAAAGDRHGHDELPDPLPTSFEQRDERAGHRGHDEVVDRRVTRVGGPPHVPQPDARHVEPSAVARAGQQAARLREPWSPEVQLLDSPQHASAGGPRRPKRLQVLRPGLPGELAPGRQARRGALRPSDPIGRLTVREGPEHREPAHAVGEGVVRHEGDAS